MTVSSIMMEMAFRAPPNKPVWPAGVRIAAFMPERHSEAVHQLLVAAYKLGGGYVGPFGAWWEQLRSDEEYDPALLFLATDPSGSLVGVAQCWTSAFIKDLAVAENWRRRGVATALLQHAFTVFWTRGAPSVGLKVEADNPSGAVQLYERLGMTPVNAG